jgi:ribosomal protein S27AE
MRREPKQQISVPRSRPLPAPEPSHRVDEAQARIAESHRICPGCGLSMIDRGCKLRCTRCGFFLDCSDG